MKPRITIRLFGKFSIHCGQQALLLHSSANAKELFCYLALNRRTPVPRESLAALISRDVSSEKSRKALRQALWQLRADLSPPGISCADRTLKVEDGWVQFVADDCTWLDVAEFERSASGAPSVANVATAPGDVKRLSQAVELYQGEFLQGWYQEWCLEERERLRQIYLETLDSLVSHCESHRDINAGVAYAVRALHTDPARECTHRALMRLYCLAGDRASAAHQYERCVEALRTELGLEPDDETKELERQVRAGHSVGSSLVSSGLSRRAGDERHGLRQSGASRRRPE
jgi:DNA-binding SARP family transcriptional activator